MFAGQLLTDGQSSRWNPEIPGHNPPSPYPLPGAILLDSIHTTVWITGLPGVVQGILLQPWVVTLAPLCLWWTCHASPHLPAFYLCGFLCLEQFPSLLKLGRFTILSRPAWNISSSPSPFNSSITFQTQLNCFVCLTKSDSLVVLSVAPVLNRLSIIRIFHLCVSF